MKKSAGLFNMLLLAVLFAVAVSVAFNVSIVAAGAIALAISFLMPNIKGVAMMAVAKNEVVIAELLKQFKEITDDFMAPISLNLITSLFTLSE